jgi:hypothetical protein
MVSGPSIGKDGQFNPQQTLVTYLDQMKEEYNRSFVKKSDLASMSKEELKEV